MSNAFWSQLDTEFAKNLLVESSRYWHQHRVVGHNMTYEDYMTITIAMLMGAEIADD